MNRILRGSFAVIAVVALGSVTAPAAARVIPASAGRAAAAGKASCFDTPHNFNLADGTVTNSCQAIQGVDDGNQWFTIPLVTDYVGYYSISVRGFQPQAGIGNQLACRANFTNWDGSALTTSGTALLGPVGAGVIDLPSTYVYQGSAGIVHCLVPPNDKIMSVYY